VYVLEVDLPTGGVGYLAPATHQGRPTYTPHLNRAWRFHTARQANDAARAVPPALDPTIVKVIDRGHLR
jgi:hypothetical protein